MTIRWADVRDVPPDALPATLVDAWVDLRAQDLRAAVREAWTAPADPESLLDAESWAELFDEAGYQHDGRPAERESDLDDLLDDVVLTLYRAAPTPHGLRWTLDPAGAAWELSVGPEYVLARFPDHLVVDVTDLSDDAFRRR